MSQRIHEVIVDIGHGEYTLSGNAHLSCVGVSCGHGRVDDFHYHLAHALFTRHLRHAPQRPDWPGRDRFILSAGHGSALLYSMLHLTGYELSMDELKNFRQVGSKTPGHPEVHVTPGVETTTPSFASQ